MLKIALFPNFSKNQAKETAIDVANFLRSKKVELFADDAISETLQITPLSEVNPKSIDFMITLGGDGTLLQAIHRHPSLDVPIMAINMGGLGFMADIPLDEIYPSLEDLLNGNYTIKNRIMMEGYSDNNQQCLAVNEVSIHRTNNPCIIDLAIYVDGLYLNTFSADGIIVSTPSGSTAYSLAAGGPILTPEVEAFVLTPICPHTISNRPIVLMPHESIKIQYLIDHDATNQGDIEISCDGQQSFKLSPNDIYSIVLSKRLFKLVCLPHHNYFLTLREKLGWRGQTPF
ncbi:MAG: NAD(+)/NADH kinase [Parachlamydiaceae bacterium]|nr:NAD(+)/NADH kinase [Parachlamydiaceae bacterium]